MTPSIPTEEQMNHIRLLIGDLRTDTMTDGDLMFSDAQITIFWQVEGHSIFKASAYGLEILANNIALLEGETTDQGFQTSGPTVAEALRLRAKELRIRVSLATHAASEWIL